MYNVVTVHVHALDYFTLVNLLILQTLKELDKINDQCRPSPHDMV